MQQTDAVYVEVRLISGKETVDIAEPSKTASDCPNAMNIKCLGPHYFSQ